MRKVVPDILFYGRITHGRLASPMGNGFNGAFIIRANGGPKLAIICGTGGGWEHVSVSLETRCPTWKEMNFVKDLFWEETETVMQLHPPKKDWVNCHPYCLHLWKPIGLEIPLPPSEMVGPK